MAILVALGCVEQAMKTTKTSHTSPRKIDPRSPLVSWKEGGITSLRCREEPEEGESLVRFKTSSNWLSPVVPVGISQGEGSIPL